MEARQALLDALTDHMAIYHCTQKHAERKKEREQAGSSSSSSARNKVLQWLKVLSITQRQAAFTIVDKAWTSLLVKMQQRLDVDGTCVFFVMPDFPCSKDNAGEPGLCFRRARGMLKRLSSRSEAEDAVTRSLMVFSSALDGRHSLDSVTLSRELLEDVDKLVEALDELSYGAFLEEQCFLGGSPWRETSWLSSMGYYSLATFVVNRLEFSVWGAWVSALGTKQPAKAISKISGRGAFEAAVIASRVCTKRQEFEDWWNKLGDETRSRMLSSAIAEVSKLEASQLVGSRNNARLGGGSSSDKALQGETNKFSLLCQGIQLLEAMGAVNDDKWLSYSPLGSVNNSSEQILRRARSIMMKVMNDFTERDLLEFSPSSATDSGSSQSRKNKHKKQHKRNVSNKQGVGNHNVQIDKMDKIGDKRKKSSKLKPSVKLMSNGSTALETPGNVLPESRRVREQTSDMRSDNSRPIACTQEESNQHQHPINGNAVYTPKTRACFSRQETSADRLNSDGSRVRQQHPKASTTKHSKHQNGPVEATSASEGENLSWPLPPVAQAGMAVGYADETAPTFPDVSDRRVSEGELIEGGNYAQFFDADYNQFFGGGVMYWTSADYTGMGYSRPASHSSEDSCWARREADLTLVVDDIVGLPPVLAPYAGNASTLTSPSSAFDHVPGSGSFEEVQNGSSIPGTSFEIAVSDRTSSQPVLAPIVVREAKLSRKGSKLEFPKLQEARSPHMPRGRKDSMRWKRSPSPVLRCVPAAPPPPPPSPVGGVKKKRGFPTVRSGSSSPRHWGVVNWPDNQDSRMRALPPEGIISWRTRCIPNAAPIHPLAGTLLRERLVSIPSLAVEQEHPDVALPMRTSLVDQNFPKMLTDMGTLQKEIEAFCLLVAAEKSIRKPFVNAAVKKVTHALQVLWPRSRIKIFGSNATGLALPNSDVDLVVCLPPVRNLEPIKEAGILEGRNGIKETCLQHAARYLADQDWVRSDSLKTIENTAIPIIMLAAKCFPDSKADDMEHGNSSSSPVKGKETEDGGPERGPWGTSEDRHIVRLDISFESPSHTGLPTAELVKELVAQFPAINPLALVLKQFLLDRGLDQPYTGGLSSYCLVLLITRFLQHQHHLGRPSQNQSLGSLLMDFLHFFGCVFDPRRMCISIRGGGMYMNRDRVHGIDPLHIEDPLHPMNNVGRNCFRILQCTKAFADAYFTLEKELCCYMAHTTTSEQKHFLLLQKILPSVAHD